MVERKYAKTRFQWIFQGLSGLLLGLMLSGHSWAAVTAQVNRTALQEGESVYLTLTAQGRGKQPDFSELEQAFEILATGRSSKVSIVNGRQSVSMQWQLELLPLKTGRVVIPSISVEGEQSNPVTLSVSGQNQPGNKAVSLFIEASLDNETPWVQSQTIMTVRVFHAQNFMNASLPDPKVDDLVLWTLADKPSSTEQRNGQQYIVTERRYAIVPQRSGEFEIPALTLEARMGDGTQSMFQRARTLRVKTKPLRFKVKSKPSVYPQDAWWLPAEKLNLTENWSGDTLKATVGEPIDRQISLAAFGVAAEQLPELILPDVDGLSIYKGNHDQETQALETGLASVRREPWTIVPNKAGKLTLPAQRLVWWDTINEQQREVMIPAKTFNVVAAKGQSSSAELNDQSSNEDQSNNAKQADSGASNDAASEISHQSLVQHNKSWLWEIMSVVFGLLWLVTLGLWWKARQSQKQEAPASENQAKLSLSLSQSLNWSELKALAESSDSAGFYRCLWASQTANQEGASSLSAWARPWADQSLMEKLQQLEQIQFAAPSSQVLLNSDELKSLYLALKSQYKPRSTQAIRDAGDVLPSL